VPSGTAGLLEGQFRYVAVTSTVLTAGETYYVAGFDPNIDGYTGDPTGFAVDPAITYLGDAWQSSFIFPNSIIGGFNGWFGGNIKFTVGSPNTAPSITNNASAASASLNFVENSTATIIDIDATDVDAGQTITFSKSGADQALFNLSAGGVLTFGSGRDFESFSDANLNGVYEVTVTATDNGSPSNLSDSQALSVTVTDVNEIPSFVKGADQLLPYNTSSAQTAAGWATAINDGDSTVTQALTFNISSNSNAGLFTTGPSIDSSTGTLTYTPNGTAGTATISVTLTDDASINGTAALTTALQQFTITVQTAPDYTVATSSGTLTVTDQSGNSDTLAITEPVAGSIKFAASGRTFSVDGGLNITGDSGNISLSGITQLTLNPGTGADNASIGAFTSTLPNVSIGSAVNRFGSVSFTGAFTLGAANTLTADASGNISSTTEGIIATGGNITLSAGSDVLIYGNINHSTGTDATLTLRANNNIYFYSSADVTSTSNKLHVVLNSNRDATDTGAIRLDSGTVITSNGGDITFGGGADPLAANAIGSASLPNGVLLSGATLDSGAGAVSLRGQGGAVAVTGSNTNGGVVLDSTDTVQTSTGNISIIGVGGTLGSTGSLGVFMRVATAAITTVDGAININGTAQTATAGNAIGIGSQGGLISATGSGSITLVGTGGTASGSFDVGVQLVNNGLVQAASGAMVITGTATSGSSSGVRLSTSSSGRFVSTGSGPITITGTGTATGFGFQSGGVSILGGPSSTGNITINADKIDLTSGTPSVQTSSTVTLRQKTNARLINLGAADSATTLGLTDAELDHITAGTLAIGDANSGALTVSAAITRSAATVLNLASGANIDLTTGSLNSAGGNVTLNPGTNVFASNSGMDVTTGAAASLTLPSADSLKIVINGATADSGYTQLNVAGLIDLTGAVLSLSGSYTPVANNILTIVNNDGVDAVTGTFSGLAEGAVVTFNGIPVTISYVGGSGNDVTLSYLNEIVVHNGSHSLAPELVDGQVTVVNFGSTAPNVASVRNFTVRNTGDADLTISSITVPSGYTTNGASAVLASGTSYNFQVALESATPATYAGNVVNNMMTSARPPLTSR
jgi:hypothetical protein